MRIADVAWQIVDATTSKQATRKEALIAASTIQKYIVDINDQFAWKLEEVLASFGRHLRLEDSQAMRATQITDYFAHT